ncbi:mechanosensitive ion channel domain-containing protein [Croceivirga thetidis]|uniref:Mechanosensitive ion channel n=1 Tax=Croceivirga thetidis TaxID=2721623 RepID=A0ABX1GQ81_9FLAO|nr:mechanosensitive ion channel [Croceivirga thetidis]
MKNIVLQYQTELFGTLVSLVVFFVLRFIISKAVRRISKLNDINRIRARLIISYITVTLAFILLLVLVLIWGVNIKDIGILLSSVFAVLGVALFATWSVLSNLTAGIILFFYFPYKIGDRIRIQDKDFPDEAIILDIKAFNVNLLKDDGELLTYPNNLLLQKGVVLIQRQVATDKDLEPHL